MVTFTESLLGAMVTLATPLVLATYGEIISERAGVLNLGIEGIMAMGALVGAVVTIATGNPILGFLAGGAVGVLISLIHGFLSISMKSDQVISGIMLTLLGVALANFLGSSIFTSAPRIDGFSQVLFPVVGQFLVGIPVIGEALFRNTIPDFLAILLLPVVWYFLFRTRLGLEITSVGDDPETADTTGVPVIRRRYLAVLVGGAFAGLAGAHITLGIAQFWSADMIAGRGWIAIALVIFAQWRPGRALLGAYFFGIIEAFALRSQQLGGLLGGVGIDTGGGSLIGFLIHPNIMAMYPFVATLVVLVLVNIGRRRQTGAPMALMKPYIREGGD